MLPLQTRPGHWEVEPRVTLQLCQMQCENCLKRGHMTGVCPDTNGAAVPQRFKSKFRCMGNVARICAKECHPLAHKLRSRWHLGPLVKV